MFDHETNVITFAGSKEHSFDARSILPDLKRNSIKGMSVVVDENETPNTLLIILVSTGVVLFIGVMFIIYYLNKKRYNSSLSYRIMNSADMMNNIVERNSAF
jgi:hypothetical protein